MPKIGVKERYKHIKKELIKNDIKMGEGGALFDLLRPYELLVKKTKRFYITTGSNHFFYKSPIEKIMKYYIEKPTEFNRRAIAQLGLIPRRLRRNKKGIPI